MLSVVKGRRLINRMYVLLAASSYLIALVPLVSIIYYTVAQGYVALSFDFFTQVTPPIGGQGGGILNAIVGSFVMVAIASVFWIPIGGFGGAYLSEYPGKFAYYVRLLSEVLAGVPSIVTGIFVYELIVVTQHHFSALSGGIALGFMMIPIVAISTDESLKLVPSPIKEGALALGISRTKTVLHVLVSTAKSSIVTGIALAVARVMGETAPLLFTALGSQFL